MNKDLLISEVNNIDWPSYAGPDYYDYKSVPVTLRRLILLNEENNFDSVYNSVLFAIGNNHCGSYYPAIIDALPIIFTVATTGDSEISRNCALLILTDLYRSFCPEIGQYDKITEDKLNTFFIDFFKNRMNDFYTIYMSNRE